MPSLAAATVADAPALLELQRRAYESEARLYNDWTIPCLIGRLVVAPELQGRGIGSSLLKALEAQFPQARVFELFTGSKSEGNIRLYRRHGYVVTDTQQLSEQVTLVVMRKHANADA